MRLFFEIDYLDVTHENVQILQNFLHRTEGIKWKEDQNKFCFEKIYEIFSKPKFESDLFRIFSGILSNHKIEGKFKFDLFYEDYNTGDLKFARTKTLESEII